MWDSTIFSLHQWSPLFYPKIEETQLNLMWVNLLGLPLEWFKEEGLREIGNLLGGTIVVDKYVNLS